jgi:two-component system chemotaxis sensor kinase CheA
MTNGDDEILQIFYEESKEHLDGIEEDLLALEKQGKDFDPDLVNSIFRAVHTIKGGCGFFGLDKLSALSHSMENILDRIRKKDIISTPEIINTLLKGADLLKEMVNSPESTNQLNIEPVVASIKQILEISFSKEEKQSTHENVDIKTPDGRVVFSVNKYEFQRARQAEKGGSNIYLVEYDLIHDIERKNKNPWDVISELLQLSVFIDSKVDIDGLGELSDEGPLHANIPFYALIATIIETDLIYDFLGLDSSKIHLISEDGKLIDPEEKEESAVVTPEKTEPAQAPEEEEKPGGQKKETEEKPQPVPPRKQKKNSANKTSSSPSPMKNDSSGSIRVNVSLLDKLMSLAGELVLARNQLLQGNSSKNFDLIENTSQKVDLITAELQEAIMATRMQAIGIVFQKFKRLVRDFSRENKKDVKLALLGEDVELDKSIIEAIGDPLTHLVRNALDHGIESPAKRKQAGKSEIGTLSISAHHEAGHVIITISDDGSGLNISKIKTKALSSGICNQDQLEAMSKKELTKLIFRPGFSTADKITDISGRGVGMDVVNNNLTKLGGTVDINSKEGEGTSVIIKLPLTLAIIPSLLLSVGNEKYSIPQVNLVELVRISEADNSIRIETVGNSKVIRLRDRLLPLVKLSEVIEDERNISGIEPVAKNGAPPEKVPSDANIAVVMTGNFQYGLIVDELLDSSEIVVKPLGRHLKKCKAYAGATILGDGRVALILDLTGISEMMNLTEVETRRYKQEETIQESVRDEETVINTDMQSLLIVHNAPEQPFGIPLGLVARIEKIRASEIEDTGGRTAIKYRDGTLPLFRLEEASSVKPLEECETYVVVVFKVNNREVGLMLSEILDVVENKAKVDDQTYRQTGIYGSTIINDRITLLIDLYGLVYNLMPEWGKEKKAEYKQEIEKSGIPTVLIAEDSKFFMTQIKGFMEEAGYQVVTAKDGKEAYDKLIENQDKVNIVLTDIEMPVMDGLEFTQQARQQPQFKSLPILAVTSIAGSAAEQKGFEVGLDEYLIKLDRDEILERCAYYLKNRRPA